MGQVAFEAGHIREMLGQIHLGELGRAGRIRPMTADAKSGIGDFGRRIGRLVEMSGAGAMAGFAGDAMMF